MDREQALAAVREYKAVVSQKLPVKDVYLFGSYANGDYRERSDIDVAVEVTGVDKDWWADSTYLWRATRNVNLSIEPVLILPDDTSMLRDEIMRTGIKV